MHPLRTLLLASLLAAAGCAGGARSPEDATAQAIADVTARLRGTWVLVRYDPELPPEPVFAAVLAAQRERMTVRFDGTRVQAEGVGFRVDRAARVTEPFGNRFVLTVWDEQGIATQTAGELEPDGSLLFQAITPPWRGTGVLRKIGP